MKKVLILILLAVLVASCSKDDDNDKHTIYLRDSGVTLKYGETFEMTALSGTPITYTSENEFHATVSNTGVVTAGRIGETNIIVDDGRNTRLFNVVVEKSSDLYEEPNMDWGISRSGLIARIGEPSDISETFLYYKTGSNSVPEIMYSFKNDKLESAVVMVHIDYSNILGVFLDERYMPISFEDGVFIFVNAVNPQDVTLVVGASIATFSHWFVVYMPQSGIDSSTRSTFSNSEIYSKAIEHLKSQSYVK